MSPYLGLGLSVWVVSTRMGSRTSNLGDLSFSVLPGGSLVSGPEESLFTIAHRFTSMCSITGGPSIFCGSTLGKMIVRNDLAHAGLRVNLGLPFYVSSKN